MKKLLSFVVVFWAINLFADSYTYDDLGRILQRVNNQGNGISYTYDKAGNLLTATSITIETRSFGLQGTPTTGMGISLSWNLEPNATEYRIYRRTDEASPWILVTILSNDTVVFVDSIPFGDTNFFYRLAAYGKDGVLAYSESTQAIRANGSNQNFVSSGQNGDNLLYELDFNAESNSTYRFEFSTTLQSDEWTTQPYKLIPADTPHTNPIQKTSGPTKLHFSLQRNDLPIFFRLVKNLE